jgi:predicted permease
MAALGASAGGLVRTVLIESLVLAAAGCASGLLLAAELLKIIIHAAPSNLTYLSGADTLDRRAVWFAVVLAFATCIVFGLVPAWRAARVDAIEALKRAARNVSIGDDWWQGALVASQLALVLVLLAGSGLLLRSFDRLTRVDPGFAVDQLAVVELQLQQSRYAAPGASLLFMQELARKAESIPGVQAAISGGAPPRSSGLMFGIKPEGEGGAVVDLTNMMLPFTSIEPDYFTTMGIRLVAGRTFLPEDGESAVIVNDVMAKRIWGDGSPIGRRFRMDSDRPWQTVVGVAADVKQMGPSDTAGGGMEVYQLIPADGRLQFYALVLRTTGDRQAMLGAVRRQVWEIDSNLPIVEASTMNDRIGESIAGPRFYFALSSAFALTGALLAAIGVYGISAYWVSRRRRELAIRVAVGATRDRLIRMVVGRSLRLAAIGALAGLALAAAGARAIESMLFQVSSRDPLTLIGVTALLVALVVLGCLGPALKASRIDPMTTLRAE